MRRPTLASSAEENAILQLILHQAAPRLSPDMRDGSHLCHAPYFDRDRVGASRFNTPDSSTPNTGRRCARDL